jgi:hypothetical protein
MSFLAGLAVAVGLTGAGVASAQVIALPDITTPIVPTSNPVGDREFGGNGPQITVGVELRVERGGRAIFAYVTMSAVETGGDGSRTDIGPVPFEVWRWDHLQCRELVDRIVTPAQSVLRYTSGPGCTFNCGTLGPSEDGGTLVTVPVDHGPVRAITLLGDTAGDDISTDQNPYGDTSIRRISFRPIEVAMQQPSLCR